jgi:hypothetical protein
MQAVTRWSQPGSNWRPWLRSTIMGCPLSSIWRTSGGKFTDLAKVLLELRRFGETQHVEQQVELDATESVVSALASVVVKTVVGRG